MSCVFCLDIWPCCFRMHRISCTNCPFPCFSINIRGIQSNLSRTVCTRMNVWGQLCMLILEDCNENRRTTKFFVMLFKTDYQLFISMYPKLQVGVNLLFWQVLCIQSKHKIITCVSEDQSTFYSVGTLLKRVLVQYPNVYI